MRKAFGATAPGYTHAIPATPRKTSSPSAVLPLPVTITPTRHQNRSGAPGIGLALEFNDDQAASRYFDLYRRQVQACTARDQPVHTTIMSGVSGLVDRRTYPDSQWTEIVERNGSRITLIILSDPRHAISKASAQRILDQIHG
jgi:hypothetical protein